VSLSIGIVGLPNVGKSTLFNALTRAGALASNYPFATIEPNVGVVGVPDPRLAELAKLYDSARIVPASVRFTDIAGLVRGASQGQGLGNQFLAHIRETDAICQVVRVFADPDVTHVDGDVSPERDIETVVTELILADLQTLEKALPRLAKETRFAKDPERARTAAAAQAAEQLLDSGTPLSSGAAAAGIDVRDLRELQLLTAKPFLYVFNMDTSELADEDLRKRLSDMVAPAEAIFLDAKTEADLAELPEDEAAELLAEAGLGEPGLAQLARAGFRALGLQTFLTAGPKETRAWEIKAGATAPEAAGVIHTDFQRGFIKAEVVSYDDTSSAVRSRSHSGPPPDASTCAFSQRSPTTVFSQRSLGRFDASPQGDAEASPAQHRIQQGLLHRDLTFCARGALKRQAKSATRPSGGRCLQWPGTAWDKIVQVFDNS
jgi:GTP-binding protein YchF